MQCNASLWSDVIVVSVCSGTVEEKQQEDEVVAPLEEPSGLDKDKRYHSGNTGGVLFASYQRARYFLCVPRHMCCMCCSLTPNSMR